MQTLLIRNAHLLLTMDAARREIADGAVFIRGNRIEAVGAGIELPQTADQVIDMRGHLVMPGLVNTHHHMYQSLTRAVPGAQDCELFDWLRRLYPIWAGLTPEMIRVSTQTAMAELILSGCTTSSDHLYIYPNGCRLDDAIEGAQEIGMRFHACRGAMSVGESQGGLPPDRVVEDEAFILRESQRLIETWHDPRDGAMLRVALAPCSPFSVSQDLMRESARMARAYGVGLHTHLAETPGDVAYSRERFGRTPAQYAEELDWLGEGVWHAHCVCLDDHGIALFGQSRTGVAHCPSSNMRLGSGIAPVKRMRAAGVAVGLGVDGSASNDSGHLLAEARQALLLARVGGDPAGLRAREALEVATLGGAAALGRRDIGALAPGMCADLVAFDLASVDFAGGLHDPAAALLFCAPAKVALSVIDGRVVVRDGQLLTVELGPLVERHNTLARQLVNGEA
ncbi:8-oxoguanine deaminase [Chitinimonas koreensis]|uniref:8-oxoguanine deaminase n=1 Tax=Chitinimonas koreensis TaxID=356302 RepID=UPI0004062F0F|nr:8-oxoguanine deaminase [Chitinimonas koreensis]QNM94820.1 8-oxoguanine deaminase [Chitinimonas koreensis]